MKTLTTKWHLKFGIQGKEKEPLDKKTAEQLRKAYPNFIPLKVAACYMGISPRQLSWLVAEGRQPFASIGANIGTRQRYVRIYTERLIAYLNGCDLED